MLRRYIVGVRLIDERYYEVSKSYEGRVCFKDTRLAKPRRGAGRAGPLVPKADYYI